MPPLVSEGQVKVWWVPAIADKSAPTVAEITAGTELTPYLPKNGLTTPASRSMVDTGSIESRFDSQAPGSWGGPVQMTLKRRLKDGAEVAWTLFEPGFVDGYVVVGRLGSASVAADEVEVYPGTSHKPVLAQTAANEEQRFVVDVAVTEEPATDAVVAA